MLLLLSFIYTDKVFSEVKRNDPVMKQVIEYKKNKDVKPIEPIITGDELILGISGLTVNENLSYKNMRSEEKFDETKIIYEEKSPNKSIKNNFNYFLTAGNNKKNNVSIIFGVNNDDSIEDIIYVASKNNVIISFFVDGKWLEKNVDLAFKINNAGFEIYNSGYDGYYNKSMITITNNLIESITLKESKYCLNINKDIVSKKICSKKKMYSVVPKIVNPSISELKSGLDKGQIIYYDLSEFNIDNFNLVINTVQSRGYNLIKLSKLLKE